MTNCRYCGKEAHWETPCLGIYICDSDKCAKEFVEDQCEQILDSEGE